MSIKTPKFWRKKSLISLILLPMGEIYWIMSNIAWKLKTPRQVEGVKVVCVGNLTLGGAGKTPTAIAIGKALKAKSINFAYLSSGYKGAAVDFCEVKIDSDHEFVGDEPILLSEVAPTFVCKDRYAALKRLKDLGYELVILDDGMQNNSVKKDFLLTVVDGKSKFGNGFLFPAGPLRQTIRSGLRMADSIVVVGEVDEYLMKKIEKCKALDKLTRVATSSPDAKKYKGKKLFAFCGLGYPEKFFSFLTELGLDVVRRKSFFDHYNYKNSDLDSLLERAKKEGLELVTTKKDWIKFSEKYRKEISFLGIDFTFEQEGGIIEEIVKITKV